VLALDQALLPQSGDRPCHPARARQHLVGEVTHAHPSTLSADQGDQDAVVEQREVVRSLEAARQPPRKRI